jgi:hypothetical protein
MQPTITIGLEEHGLAPNCCKESCRPALLCFSSCATPTCIQLNPTNSIFDLELCDLTSNGCKSHKVAYFCCSLPFGVCCRRSVLQKERGAEGARKPNKTTMSIRLLQRLAFQLQYYLPHLDSWSSKNKSGVLIVLHET